jgi:hypothetical protein
MKFYHKDIVDCPIIFSQTLNHVLKHNKHLELVGVDELNNCIRYKEM